MSTETVPETEPSTLAYLGWVLEESGFKTRLREADAKQPYEDLLVLARQDAQGRELTVRLVFAEELVQALYQAAHKNQTPQSYASLLQFTLWFPHLGQIPAARYAEMDELLNLINEQLTFGVLGHNPSDQLHLHHHFMLHAEEADPRLVAEIISAMGFMAEKYGTLLENWLRGQIPFGALCASLK